MPQTMTFFSRSFLVANSFLVLSASNVLSQTLPPPPPENNSQSEKVREYEFEAPSDSSSASGNKLFRVQIYGSSEQLLSVVRRVEPDAFVRDGKDVIQAGLFSDQAKANSLVEELDNQGVEAEIIPINEESQSRSSNRESISLSSADSTPINKEPPSPEEGNEAAIADSSQNQTESKSRAYYVVIPGNREQVSTLVQRAQEAGVKSDLIQQRDAPRGTHVAVGPFESRNEASRWNEQLKAEGLDRARVYFGR
ncbi:MAG: SPOR domain-containing protein [Halothece sp.]